MCVAVVDNDHVTEGELVNMTITNSIFNFLRGHLPVKVQGRIVTVEGKNYYHPVTGKFIKRGQDYHYVLVKESEFRKYPDIPEVKGVDSPDYDWCFHMTEVEIERE